VNAMSGTQIRRPWPTDTGPNRYRRGMYTFFFRSLPAPELALFDAPDGTSTCTRRIRSNSPLQALTLLNDEAFLEFAQAMAQRTLKEVPASDLDRLNYAYVAATGRRSGDREIARLQRFLADQRQVYQTNPGAAVALVAKDQDAPNPKQATELASWTAVCRVLFNLDDFMTRE
jgi:hypothetical protein